MILIRNGRRRSPFNEGLLAGALLFITVGLLGACSGEPRSAETVSGRTDAGAETGDADAGGGATTAGGDGGATGAPGRGAGGREMSWTGVLSQDEFKALHELKEGEVMDLRGDMVELAGGHAYLSLPDGDGPHPGLVVIQEWWGLNDNIKLWSDRLAAEGFAALAVDLYDGTVATTRNGAYEAMQAVQEDRALEILQAGFARLAEDPRIRAEKRGSIGWCFGGGWSLQLALNQPDLDACVIYYGRLVDDPAELGKIGATVCGIFGNQDAGIPPESVDAFEAGLNEAGVSFEVHRFDAEHAFANPSSARYNHEAAGNAWRVVRSFLKTNLQ